MSDRREQGRETGAIGAGAVVALAAFSFVAIARRMRGATRSERAGAASERKSEREDPAVREGVVAAVMAGFFAFVVVAAVGLSFFYRSLTHDAGFGQVGAFPAPRLQTGPDGKRDPEIARQQAELHAFRWIDRSRGLFQIPIERAMRLVAERGAKAYDPVSPETQAASRAPEEGAAR